MTELSMKEVAAILYALTGKQVSPSVVRKMIAKMPDVELLPQRANAGYYCINSADQDAVIEQFQRKQPATKNDTIAAILRHRAYPDRKTYDEIAEIIGSSKGMIGQCVSSRYPAVLRQWQVDKLNGEAI
jgi:hypothetical protein